MLAMGVVLAGAGACGATTTAKTRAAMTVPALARVVDPVAQVARREIQVSVRVPPVTADGVVWVELARVVILGGP